MIRFHRMLVAPALAGGMVLAGLTAPLLAQEGAQPGLKSAQPSETQDGAAARAKLNASQAAAAQAQVAGNVNAQADYERQLAEVEAAKAKIAADAAAAQAAYEAEKLRRDAEYQAAREKWQADVDACNKGHKSRCAAPAAPE
ncbi:MAG: hypothetical protein P0Y56_03590 [Candidatus Andeanibacterium colombiense]|uniref:Cell wall hydrolase n=1 Tax=Candidatus Andeanibacterium colombiense TaxID=3121345 RepID=A0AAJ6BPP5_9SPHN|nr:MAG: hypothetical protein P0Y56_03590 [Sphingomonadaceae bacterium]